MACLVRVPTENVKQKMQAGLHNSASATVTSILKTRGPLGFYSGYLTTVMREIPFSFIQFPIYEALKAKWASRRGGRLESYEAAACGSVSGAIAAGVTTPIDVVKTRIMLGKARYIFSRLVNAPGELHCWYSSSLLRLLFWYFAQ